MLPEYIESIQNYRQQRSAVKDSGLSCTRTNNSWFDEWCLRVRFVEQHKIGSICGGTIKVSTLEDSVWAFTVCSTSRSTSALHTLQHKITSKLQSGLKTGIRKVRYGKLCEPKS